MRCQEMGTLEDWGDANLAVESTGWGLWCEEERSAVKKKVVANSEMLSGLFMFPVVPVPRKLGVCQKGAFCVWGWVGVGGEFLAPLFESQYMLPFTMWSAGLSYVFVGVKIAFSQSLKLLFSLQYRVSCTIAIVRLR